MSMPTYEYGCSACGHEWEEVQRITEPPDEVCPKCAQSTAHRLISGGTNFILKGGGWYSDLYSSPKAASAKADAPSADGAVKSEAKSEGKSEARAESPKKTEGKAAAPSSTPSSTPASS